MLFEKLSAVNPNDPFSWGEKIFLTLDIDWAPDFAIEYVAEKLVERQIRATWFVTHKSKALNLLQDYSDLFELGIHPNFRPESSHGQSVEEVMQFCMELVPNAKSMRTHGLLQSSRILASVATQWPISLDASLFLPDQTNLKPFVTFFSGLPLLRVPTFWFDDYQMEKPNPSWKVRRRSLIHSGLKVFGFHPTHIYLNSSSRRARSEISAMYPDLAKVPQGVFDFSRHPGAGVETSFESLLDTAK